MVESYKRFWSNIFVFDGKSSRADFWWPWLINAILAVVIIAIIQSITGHPIDDIYNWKDLGIASARNVVSFLAWLATWTVTVRRLHDTDRSGWWILIQFIPVIGGIWLFVLLVLRSKETTRWD